MGGHLLASRLQPQEGVHSAFKPLLLSAREEGGNRDAGTHCVLDHELPILGSIVKELATCLVLRKEEVGLSEQQFEQVFTIPKNWRSRYMDLTGEALRLEAVIHDELAGHSPDVRRIDEPIGRRTEPFRQTESEFVRNWVAIFELMTQDQYQRLMEVYAEELQPPPERLRSARYVTKPAGV